MTPAEALLDRLDGVRRTRTGWTARCPSHEDRRNSLKIDPGADGKLLLHCFAGCRPEEILRARGLDWTAVFSERGYRPRVMRPAQETELQRLRREGLARDRRIAAKRRPWLRLWEATTIVREHHRVAGELRADVTAALTADDPDAWRLLDHAAALDTYALNLEAELDAAGADLR